MPNKQKNLELIERLLAVVDTKKNTEEMVKVFSLLLETFQKLKNANQQEREEIKGLLKQTIAELKDNGNSNFESVKEKVDKALKEQENGMNFLRDKARKLENGRDGVDGKDGVNGKDGKDGAPDTPQQVRDKLETLNDEEKLRIEAIYKLEERLKELEKRPIFKGGGGGFSVIAWDQHIVDDESLTGTINGTNKDFTIKHAPSPVASLKVYRGGARQRITEDYTFSGVTISFTNAPQVGEVLLADYRL